MSTSFYIGAWGWQHPAWETAYYPEEMPVEWRLGYFSNEFRCVMVPARQWLAAPVAEIRQWTEDVHDEFYFLLAWDEAAAAPEIRQQVFEKIAILSSKLVGLVVSAEALATLPDGQDGERLAALGTLFVDEATAAASTRPVWRPGAAVGAASSVGILSAAQAQAGRRALKDHVAAFMEQAPPGRAYLLFEGEPPALSAMRDAIIIVDLLNVST